MRTVHQACFFTDDEYKIEEHGDEETARLTVETQESGSVVTFVNNRCSKLSVFENKEWHDVDPISGRRI